jgi:hypothetical protein
VIDDVDVLEGEAVLPQDGADTVGPAAVRLQVGFDRHAVNRWENKNAPQ